MVALREQRDIGEELARLAEALEDLDFGPDSGHLSAARDRLAGTIRTYLIPRTIEVSAPMTVVLAGPTGSGKSTMMNSLSGLDVSKTGALRPTTRSPVVLTSREHSEGYRAIGGVPCEVVTGEARILESIVLVDAPDLDSTSTDHRAMAETLIDNADVVVFVTSALRYADDVPWQVLRRAVSRDTPVLHVLNRVGSASAGAVVDLRSRLAAGGLYDDVIVVPEHHLGDGAQQVPPVAIRSLRNRLGEVVANRDEFAGEVFDRVLRSTIEQATDLLHSISEISDGLDDLDARLSAYLGDRVAHLELGEVAGSLYPPPPDERSRRALRRWRKRVRRTDEEEVVAAEGKLVDQILSIVHTDIRQWLVEERVLLRNKGVDPADVIPDVVAMAQSTLEGWVGYVARVAADHDAQDVWLNEAVLLEAAVAEDEVPAAEMVMGDEAAELVERARRELIGRLEAIYAHAGQVVLDAIRRRHGDLDEEDLRVSLGAMTSTLAPVYA